MKFKMNAPVEEGTIFAPDVKIDIVGEPISFEGTEVGTVIGYEIVNGKLILECESEHPFIMEMFGVLSKPCEHDLEYVGIQDGRIYYKCEKCDDVVSVPQEKND